MSRERGAHERRIEVHDLPSGVVLAMSLTQAVLGTIAAWYIARTVQRAFTGIYAIVTTEHEPIPGRAR